MYQGCRLSSFYIHHDGPAGWNHCLCTELLCMVKCCLHNLNFKLLLKWEKALILNSFLLGMKDHNFNYDHSFPRIHIKQYKLVSLNSRPSQIVCMFTTMYIMCMQMVLCVHKNLCLPLIPQSKNNLNLPMSFFYCSVPGCLLLSLIMLS